MIDIYGFTTGNSFRASIALAEGGLPFRAHRIDLRAREHKGEPYLALNPTGRVPTMIDDDGPDGRLVITQSNAIMLYVAEKSGTLWPRSGLARIEAFEWWMFAVTDLIAPSNQGSFLTQGDDSPEAAAASAKLDERGRSMYAHVEKRLAEHPYLGGDTFSLADIAAYTITRWLQPQKTQSVPNIERWFADVGARPGVIAGLAAFDPQ